MKIYTKTGDDGKTSLIGGKRVSKNHLRIDAYGTIDELNSHLGLLRDQNENKSRKEELIRIQETLFTIGSHLASEDGYSNFPLPELKNEEIQFLENQIDEMELHLEPMKNFILPGGNNCISFTHIARCVCRRAERAVIGLLESTEINPFIIKYLNRLSDYLFVLARLIIHETKTEEIPWISRKK